MNRQPSRSWLSRILSRRARKSARTKPSVALRVEEMEDRTTPTGSWSLLANPVPAGDGAQTMQLLSNGNVLVHGGSGNDSSAFYVLTPDASGSYANGTWTTTGSMNESRLFYTSAVLPSGKVFAIGGEYPSFSSTSEIYDPGTGTWTYTANSVPTPDGLFGDDPITVLSNGKILAGYYGGTQTYLYDPATDTWSSTGNKLHGDQSDEESWVTLPDGSVLSYDVFGSDSSGTFEAQRYIPSTGTWVDASNLSATNPPSVLSSNNEGFELGPAFLTQDGRVFFEGANGNTAFYDIATNTWSAGPTLPGGLVAADAPSAMLPNGDILMALSPHGSNSGSGYSFPSPTTVYEFNPTTDTFTDVTPSGFDLNNPSYTTTMLVLPTGQVLMSNYSGQLAVYTPSGTTPTALLPTIGTITNNGTNFTLNGTQLTGQSEGAAYGDDNEMATNYPIVRLTDTSGNVTYATTSNWSTGSIAAGTTLQTTNFSDTVAPGAYLLAVSASGISSDNVLYIQMGTGANNITLNLDPLDSSKLQVREAGVGVIAEYALSSFTGIRVVGDSGNDTLTVDYTNGTFAPTNGFDFEGGGGTDTIAAVDDSSFTLSDSALAIAGGGTITLNGITQANLTGGTSANTFNVSGWTGTASVTGGGGSDTLIGANTANTWTINGANAGNLNGTIQFSGIANLTGGTANDQFTFVTGGSLTGTITGGGGTDTVTGANTANTWTINGANAGTINGASFQGITNLTGGTGDDQFTLSAGASLSGVITGGGGNDTVVGANSANTWTITGANAGTVSGISFQGIANLTGGTANDQFTFDASGSLTGTITGGGGTDTVTGANTANTWTITGANAGTINGTSFQGITNLTGGTANDQFTFGSSGSLSGGITGGGGTDTVVGANAANTWTITGANAGTINGTSFQGITNLTGGSANDQFTLTTSAALTGVITGGGGTDTVVGANATNVWTITGANAGNVNGAIQFQGIANLIGGTGGDWFVFQTGGNVSGTIDGGAGTDTLNFTALDPSPAVQFAGLGTIDGFAGTVSGLLGGGFLNIDDVTGNANSDSFTGPNIPTVWTITATGTTLTAGGHTVAIGSTYRILNGGAAGNTFNVLSTASPLTINGGAGTNTFNIGPDLSKIGPLTINGGAGATLNVSDVSGPAGTGMLTSTQLTGFGMGAGGITYSGITQLNFTFSAAAGGNVLNVLNTAGNTSVHGSGAADTLNVGGGATLSNLTGLLSFAGAGNDTLNLFDQNTIGATAYGLTATQFTRTGGVVVDYSGLSQFLLDGANGNNQYTIVGTGAANTQVVDGTGSSSFTIQTAGLTGTNTFRSNGSNDTFAVNTGLSVGYTALNLIGGAGNNALIYNANGGSIATLPGSLASGGVTILTYSNIDSINLNNTSGVNAEAGPDTADRATAFAGLSAQERFVQALYLDILGRAGSKAELDGYAALFNTPGSSQSQVQATIAQTLENSQEGLDRVVQSWYLTYLGRTAQNGEEMVWVNELQSGLTEEEVLSNILGTSEFYARAQTLVTTGTADERFGEALYLLLLNRAGDAGGVAASVANLAMVGRQGVALGFLESQEFRTEQFEGYYEALLHRPSDPAGLSSFVTPASEFGSERLPSEFTTIDIESIRVIVESSGEFFTNG